MKENNGDKGQAATSTYSYNKRSTTWHVNIANLKYFQFKFLYVIPVFHVHYSFMAYICQSRPDQIAWLFMDDSNFF